MHANDCECREEKEIIYLFIPGARLDGLSSLPAALGHAWSTVMDARRAVQKKNDARKVRV